MRTDSARGRRTPAFAVAALILVSACSGGDGSSEPEPELRPRLSLSAQNVTIEVRFGEAAPSTSVELANPGTGPLVWTASGDADWLTVSPASGTVAPGQSQSLGLVANLAGLTPGRWEGAVTIAAGDAEGSPTQVDVSLVLTESPPAVSAFLPVDGATDVGIEATVSVTFSEAVDPTSLTSQTLFVEDGTGARVEGTLAWDAATRTATFTPDQPFTEFRTVYAVTVEGVRGPGGTPMPAAAETGFTTVFVDPDWLYQLHNEFQGPGLILDNFAPAGPQDPRFCYLGDATAQTGGSRWAFELLAFDPPAYLMKSVFGGDDLALEGGDGMDPCLLTGLAPEGGTFSGQAWTFPPVGDPYPGAYRLQNLSFGTDRSLDVTNTGVFPETAYMAPTANLTGQVWYFTRTFRRQ